MLIHGDCGRAKDACQAQANRRLDARRDAGAGAAGGPGTGRFEVLFGAVPMRQRDGTDGL